MSDTDYSITVQIGMLVVAGIVAIIWAALVVDEVD